MENIIFGPHIQKLTGSLQLLVELLQIYFNIIDLPKNGFKNANPGSKGQRIKLHLSELIREAFSLTSFLVHDRAAEFDKDDNEAADVHEQIKRIFWETKDLLLPVRERYIGNFKNDRKLYILVQNLETIAERLHPSIQPHPTKLHVRRDKDSDTGSESGISIPSDIASDGGSESRNAASDKSNISEAAREERLHLRGGGGDDNSDDDDDVDGDDDEGGAKI
jgi:hypothetical protein